MSAVGIYTPPEASTPAPAAAVSETFDKQLTAAELEVTPSAQEKLAEIVSQSEDDIEGVRIYVGGGGCSGMTYGMTFTDEVTEFDTVLQFDSFKVLVDTVALNYLRGAQIDYIQEVGRERFVFNNVFAETGGSGGCGTCGSAGGGCS
jgi:iron-sulfur cluster insertion protein